MKQVTRPYLKNKRLILESGKSQKGSLFPIAAALALLAGELTGKIIGRGKKGAMKIKKLFIQD